MSGYHVSFLSNFYGNAEHPSVYDVPPIAPPIAPMGTPFNSSSSSLSTGGTEMVGYDGFPMDVFNNTPHASSTDQDTPFPLARGTAPPIRQFQELQNDPWQPPLGSPSEPKNMAEMCEAVNQFRKYDLSPLRMGILYEINFIGIEETDFAPIMSHRKLLIDEYIKKANCLRNRAAVIDSTAGGGFPGVLARVHEIIDVEIFCIRSKFDVLSEMIKIKDKIEGISRRFREMVWKGTNDEVPILQQQLRDLVSRNIETMPLSLLAKAIECQSAIGQYQLNMDMIKKNKDAFLLDKIATEVKMWVSRNVPTGIKKIVIPSMIADFNRVSQDVRDAIHIKMWENAGLPSHFDTSVEDFFDDPDCFTKVIGKLKIVQNYRKAQQQSLNSTL